MRSFFQITLINEIAENPFAVIGQRRYRLMESYLMPWQLFTEVKIEPDFQKEIDTMPAIEEFVANEFGEKHSRTVRFDYYLGWIAEDEKQLLDLVINRIQKYESSFPIPLEGYSFDYKLNSVPDLRNSLLKHVLRRPQVYGVNDFAGLRAFLDGYFRFKSDYQLNLSDYEIKLLQFINYWKCKVNKSLPFETWDRVFLFEKMGTTNFTNMFAWELERFEEILTEEIGMDLILLK